MKIVLVMVCAAALAAALPAGAVEKKALKCFTLQEIRGHTIADDHTVYLNVGGRSVFRVEMRNNCLGGASPTAAIELKSHGSDSICGPSDLDIGATVNGGGLPSRCIVDDVVKLTPKEASALPKSLQP